MQSETTSTDSPPTWEVEHLRVTAFTLGASTLDPSAAWEAVAQQPPEDTVIHQKIGETLVSGPVDLADVTNADLLLRTQTGRIDWVLRAISNEGSPSASPPTIGTIPGCLNAFTHLTSRYAQSPGDEILRFALAGGFLSPAGSREEAVSVLNRYLPFTLDPPAHDFMFRMNEPLASTALSDATRINRLLTWQVIQIDMMMLSLSASAQVLPPPTPPFISARLDFDFNTRADRSDALPSEELENLLSELGALINATITESDVG